MKKWRRNFSLAVLTAGLLILAPNFANAGSCGSCEPCNTCDPCGWDCCSFNGFDFGVDFLWWKPCVDDLDFGAEQKGDKFEYHSICPDWEPGVRVTLTIPDFYCDFGFKGSWTYIESDDSSSFSNSEDVLATLLHASVAEDTSGIYDRAKGSWEACYNEWDLLFYYNMNCNSCHNFMPFFGVAGITLFQEFKANYFDSGGLLAKAEWESDYWGAGFRIGADYNYRFSDCLSFFVKSSGTILAGVADSEHVSKGRDEPSGSFGSKKIGEDDECCQIVPGCYIGAGFIYDTNICDFDFSFKLGYEFVNWYNLPNQRMFPEDDFISHSTSSNTRTFGFHGLTAGLAFSF